MNTILDTLSTFIGFVGIMLLLSLIVTALVQFLQSLVSLRARNLRIGLESLIESVLPQPPPDGNAGGGDDQGGQQRRSRKSPRELADEVIEESQFVPSALNRFSRFISPAVTWVEKEELIEHLKKAGVTLGAPEKERLTLLFQRMEAYLNKRFTMFVRIITFVCAVVVAGYFQVDAVGLLKRLATDPQYRAAADAASVQLSQDAPALIAASTNYQNLSEQALAELAVRHPEQVGRLERASGLGEARADIVGELRTALAPLAASERDKIVAEYEQLLAGLNEKAVKASGEQVGVLTERLSAYDIVPWPKGWGYFACWKHVIGVLITAIFLSFGAPFWYERLRELIQLRDALKPKPQTAQVEDGRRRGRGDQGRRPR